MKHTLKQISLLLIACLMVACSVKKPSVNDGTIGELEGTDNGDGTITYTQDYIFDVTGVKPNANNPLKEITVRSIITFDTSKQAAFEAKPAYKFNTTTLGFKGPDQYLGGMTYEQYMNEQVKKEMLEGIAYGADKLGGLNEQNLTNSLKLGNSFLAKQIKENPEWQNRGIITDIAEKVSVVEQ